MHELAIARNIVEIVEAAARGRRVKRVTVDIGELSGVLPDSVEFCFEIAAKGTLLDGARLDVHRIAGRARCRICGSQFDIATLFQPCQCGSQSIERIAGEVLKVRDMEIEGAA